MWLKYIWITIAVVTAISNNVLSQHRDKNEHDTRKIEKVINNSRKINSQMVFGDIIADSIRDVELFSNVNKNCSRDGQQFMTSLNNQSRWAIQMYDSSSKYPSGILHGDIIELGNFDQCMSASSKQFGIQAGYALVSVQFGLSDNEAFQPLDVVTAELLKSKRNPLADGPENLLWAFCFPDSCTKEDIQFSFEKVLLPTFESYNITVNVDVPPLLYTSKNSILNPTNGTLIIYGIFIVGIILVFVGTLHDIFTDRSKTKNNTFFDTCLYSFSLITNMKNLTADRKSNEFSVINGMKALGVFSVIIGHRVSLDLGTPEMNHEFSDRIYTDIWFAILKSPITVEVFFIISGFLTFTLIEERLQSGKGLKFIYIMIYRLVRLLPMYVTVLLIFAYVLPYMGDGPLWKLILYPEAEFCRKNWWTNMLFINNYVNTNEMCMLHSWYLACDVHFFVVGVLITYIIWKWKKPGLFIFCVIFIASIYLPAKYIYENNHWGTMPYFHSITGHVIGYPLIFSNMKNLRTTEFFQKVYIKSHFRITTYLIGLASGYIYLRIKSSMFKLSIKSRCLGIVLCFLLHNSCYLATGYLYLPSVTYNPWLHSMFFTFQRIVYALTISYFLVVSSLSNFGFISSFFKCKLFTVISRISFVLYLVHFIVQLQSVAQIRQPQYGSSWILFSKLCGDLTTSLLYSLPINLIIEAPTRKIFNHIMNIILKVSDTPNKTNSETYNVNNAQILNSILSQSQENHKL